MGLVHVNGRGLPLKDEHSTIPYGFPYTTVIPMLTSLPILIYIIFYGREPCLGLVTRYWTWASPFVVLVEMVQPVRDTLILTKNFWNPKINIKKAP